MLVFDRAALLAHRRRAAPHLARHDFLFRAAAERLADRLRDVRRSFAAPLVLGVRPGALAELRAAGVAAPLTLDPLLPADIVAEEEALPVGDGSADLVFSPLVLHWVNDLPGALIQARRALRPDGLFLASLFGAETLRELRAAWLAAEAEVEGGASPRVAPFVDVRDGGALLQRAGFALPVADAETLDVTYADALALMRDLRGMGEANAVLARRRTCTRRATLFRMAQLYAERFPAPGGRIRATFQLVTLTGWAPAPTQQQPLRPGQATARLQDALERFAPPGDKEP